MFKKHKMGKRQSRQDFERLVNGQLARKFQKVMKEGYSEDKVFGLMWGLGLKEARASTGFQGDKDIYLSEIQAQYFRAMKIEQDLELFQDEENVDLADESSKKRNISFPAIDRDNFNEVHVVLYWADRGIRRIALIIRLNNQKRIEPADSHLWMVWKECENFRIFWEIDG